MTDTPEKAPERNKAGKALFQVQFMVMMLNVGRTEEADRAFQKAQELLTELEQELGA